MDGLKRYDLVTVWCKDSQQDVANMEQFENGQYVKYSDILPLIELRDYLERERNPNIYVAIDMAINAREALKKVGIE